MNIARRQMMDNFSMRVTSHTNCHVEVRDVFVPVLTKITYQHYSSFLLRSDNVVSFYSFLVEQV